ncbi:NAD(P)-binding domain-containing protein [Actinomycetospora lemnae]|uniref:Ketol-acid reductoisomerase type 1 n=1 Tax=Actinomycetospora lemnae TaxID=3019891 RepID=A0ABT5T017_9PSEU|nr:NAD(P)-binding domain-containing protein [Actinomycetospora sp. DW7H6]MDD7967726.1 NAD(P)-binding domain-containing protein [Actinomycetospora sp. DW7H6]
MAHAEIHQDRTVDAADLAALSGRTIAVLGFGNQGAAQAANLRDSGLAPVVGNREDEYVAGAREQGFDVRSIAEAAAAADIALLLVPDEVQPDLVRDEVAPGLRAGDTLVVASGYNWHFGLLAVPDGVDVVMVAPRMIGAAVRDRYVDRHGFPCFVSVERDATGHAWDTTLAVARAIGGTLGGAIVSSAREEAALDLFSEQAVWPAILDVVRTAHRVAVEAGFSEEAVLNELYLSAEPAEVFAHVAREGLFGQLGLHSRTSQYGQLRSLAALDEQGELARRFTRVMHDDILSGAFAREWSRPEAGEQLEALHREAAASPIAAAEAEVRARLGT